MLNHPAAGAVKEPLIRAENLSKSFPGVKALNNVSLNVYPGEIHALTGENGSGKSTLSKCIGGLYQPDTGTIFLDGRGGLHPQPGCRASVRHRHDQPRADPGDQPHGRRERLPGPAAADEVRHHRLGQAQRGRAAGSRPARRACLAQDARLDAQHRAPAGSRDRPRAVDRGAAARTGRGDIISLRGGNRSALDHRRGARGRRLRGTDDQPPDAGALPIGPPGHRAPGRQPGRRGADAGDLRGPARADDGRP